MVAQSTNNILSFRNKALVDFHKTGTSYRMENRKTIFNEIINFSSWAGIRLFKYGKIYFAEKFVLSVIIRTFAASVPTKPLSDAQMSGAFLYIYVLLSKYANGKITARKNGRVVGFPRIQFQFHKGSIKTKRDCIITYRLRQISIP